MKCITALLGIFCVIWFCTSAHSQSGEDFPDDYAYLARLHVRPAVINCVAELDRWIRSTSRYDMLLAPDRRVLKAKVDTDGGVFAGSSGSRPVESTVTMRAFARLRSKEAWIPVVARCGVWHQHVVDVSLQPFERQSTAVR